MKFCKKYEEYMQGQDQKKLPGVGFKKLKKILKKCRREENHFQSQNLDFHNHDSSTCPHQYCPVCDGTFFPSLLKEMSAVVGSFNERAQKLLELHLASGFRKCYIWFKDKLQRNHVALIEEGKDLVSYALINAIAMRKILKKYDKIHYSKQGQAFKSQVQSMHIEILQSPWLCELMAFHINLRETKTKTKEAPAFFDGCSLIFNNGKPSLSCELFESVKLDIDLTCSICLIGDIPDAEIKPPENVLFACKLNPVTEDDTIFSRFGTVTSAEIIRDFKTGDSLCYAFIEFEDTEACNQAYFKMDNALIDDRRIHVDFSQSVAKLWSQYRRKDHKKGNGRGCFKCGSLDHIAKDCTGSPTAKHQPAKYILKDENTQHGGDNKSRYEMVFDGDSGGSPQQNKRRRNHEGEDHIEKTNVNRQSPHELKHRDYRHKDSRDRHRHNDRSKEHGDDERDGGGRMRSLGGRDNEHDKRDGREFRSEIGGSRRDEKVERENKKVDNDSPRDRRDEREHRNRSADKGSRGGTRDEIEYKKRSAENDFCGDRRDEREHRNKSTNKGSRGDVRDEREYRKRSAEDDFRGGRDEREHTNRSADKNCRGDGREYKKKSADNVFRGDSQDERDSKKRGTDNDTRADRRDDESRQKGKVDNKRDRRDELYDRKTHADYEKRSFKSNDGSRGRDRRN